LLSSSDTCQAIFDAQKGACLPLSGTSPAVSAGGCPVQNWFRDVLVSLGGVRIVASLKPKLFCGVAFYGEKITFTRACAGAEEVFRGAGHLRHNTCQPTEISQSRNASTPTEPITTLLLLLQTIRPKRETIRMRRTTVKRSAC